MNIYLMERTDSVGWDAFRGHVVAADSEEDARAMFSDAGWGRRKIDQSVIAVTLIGTAAEGVERGVILSDFKAG